MKTGARFWQLIGVVCLVLSAYALAELYDAVQAKQAELDNERLLLARQEDLLRDNQWTRRLHAIQKIRNEWQAYLPVEDSPALAKAHFLSTLRYTAQNAGLSGLTIGATDLEGNEQNSSAKAALSSTRQSEKGKAGKSAALPPGVQMTKLRITGRFEPAAFVKLLRALEQEAQFVKIDSVTVRSAQLEIGMRAYWRIKAQAPADANPAVLPSQS
jgi:hypothetical protein